MPNSHSNSKSSSSSSSKGLWSSSGTKSSSSRTYSSSSGSWSSGSSVSGSKSESKSSSSLESSSGTSLSNSLKWFGRKSEKNTTTSKQNEQEKQNFILPPAPSQPTKPLYPYPTQPMTYGDRDSLGGRVLDNVLTGMAVGTGSAIAHKVIGSIGYSSDSGSNSINNLPNQPISNPSSNPTSHITCSDLKEFYSKMKYNLNADPNLNIEFINFCSKFKCDVEN